MHSITWQLDTAPDPRAFPIEVLGDVTARLCQRGCKLRSAVESVHALADLGRTEPARESQTPVSGSSASD